MLNSYVRAVRSFGRNVRLVLIVSAILAFVVDGVYPVIFNLYILRMGFGPEFVGQVNSVALIVYSLSSLAAGAIGMRLGLRTTMVIGVFVTLFSAIALSLSDLMPHAVQAYWLMGLFSLFYFGVALYFVVSPAALVTATPRSERAHVISVQSAFNNLLAFVAGSLAGVIPVFLALRAGWSVATPLPYRVPLLMAAALCVLAAVVVLAIKPIQAHEEQQEHRATGAPPAAIGFAGTLLILSLIRFLQTAGSGSTLTFFNVYMDDGLGVSTALIGMVVAVAHLVAVFMALAVPAITRKLGYGRAAVVGSLGVGLSLFPLALIPIWEVGGASFIALSALTSLRYSSFFVYSMEVTPPPRRAAMAGVGEFAGGLSFALVSLVGGYVIVRFGYALLFMGAAGLTLLGSLVLALYLRRAPALLPITSAPVSADPTEIHPEPPALALLDEGAAGAHELAPSIDARFEPAVVTSETAP